MDPLEQYLSQKSSGGDPLADYLSERAPQKRERAHHYPEPKGMFASDEDLGIASPPIRHGTADSMTSGPLLSAADRATFGGLGTALRVDKAIANNPIARAVDAIPVVGPLIGKRGGAVADRSLNAMHDYRSEHPTASMYTDLPGYMSGGPRAVAAGIERTIPQVTNKGAQVARAILGSGATSGTVAGAESVMRGDEPGEVLRETGRGTAGGIAVGTPLSVGAGLMQGAAKAILGSKGVRAREYLTQRGQPLTAPDTSDSAIGAAAQRADEAVKSRMTKYKGEVATGPYVDAINGIPQEAADAVVNVTPIYRDLQLAANDPTNLRVADKLNMLVNMLGDRPLMTQQELNGLRSSLAGIAGVGETTAGKMAPLRRAYESVKALVDQGPYAEANRRFSSGMKDLDESLDMVGLRQTTNPDEPIAGNLRVKAQRAGQNTVTAGGDTEALDLEAFKAKHPELANAIDAPEILRKQGDLSFNMTGPSHGGFIERHGLHLSPAVIAAIHALGGGWKGAASVPLALAIQNRNAIAGRLLYNPALSADIAAQMMLGRLPQLAGPGREAIQEGR